MIKYILWEHIFLSIYPEERESLLGAIKNLRQETEIIILKLTVENSVSLWELETIFLIDWGDLLDLKKSLYTNKEVAAERSTLIGIKLNFLVTLTLTDFYFFLAINNIFTQ